MTSPRLRWFLVLIIVLASLWFAKDVPVREDALDLLPGSQVRADLALLQRIGLVDRVFISLEIAEDISLADLRSSVKKVGESLTGNPLFSRVVYRLPEGFEMILGEILFPALPNLLSPDDLDSLVPRLSDEGVRQIMESNFALLNSPAGLAMKKQVLRDPFGLLPNFLRRLEELRGELAISVRDGFFFSQDGRHCLLWAESSVPLTDSHQAELVDKQLRDVLAKGLAPGVKARIIGPLPHTLANARTVENDLKRLLPMAFGVLVFLLVATLKSWRALVVVAVPFLAAPVAVVVLGQLFGSISIMALGFGIVLLGISVDFAVHIYLAKAWGRGTTRERLTAILRPVAMASATTLGVFVILLFSAVPSHRQMAALALVGVALAVIFAWLLVPTLATDKKNILSEIGGVPFFKMPKNTSRFVGAIFIFLWIGLLIAGGLSWTQLHFSGDLRAMDVPSAVIAEDEKVFRQVWGQGENQAFIVAAGRDLGQALDANYRVYEFFQHLGVPNFQSLAGVLPGPVVQKRNRQAWQNFWDEYADDLAVRFDRIGSEYGFVPDAYGPFFQWIKSESPILEPESLLKGPLGPFILSLLHFPDAGLSGDDQRFLVTTLVNDDSKLRSALAELGQQFNEVSIMSPNGWRVEVEELLQRDIVRLSIAAGLLILFLVVLFFREARGVAGALAPVLAALAAMAVYDISTSRDLNLMHLLMTIMVIGLAVDYGIFSVCAARQVIERSAILGVSICAASTITGFGVLTFATHPALHALGATVLVGIGAAWPTAVFVTPFIAGDGGKE